MSARSPAFRTARPGKSMNAEWLRQFFAISDNDFADFLARLVEKRLAGAALPEVPKEPKAANHE
jgi:hypothetical protein